MSLENYIEVDLNDFINLLDEPHNLGKIKMIGDSRLEESVSVDFKKCHCGYPACYLLIVIQNNNIIKYKYFNLEEGIKELQKYVKNSEWIYIYNEIESHIIEVTYKNGLDYMTHIVLQDIYKYELAVPEPDEFTDITNLKYFIINWYAWKYNYFRYFVYYPHETYYTDSNGIDLGEHDFYFS